MDRTIENRLYDAFLSSAGVSTDSRRIEPGVMFFALRGDNFDGNLFAAAALESGAGMGSGLQGQRHPGRRKIYRCG